ncbi:MAG TPA: flavin reductase [Spirochaetales bacterium]|nr:flavin reductase [Spirochaetales bacterium]
MQEYRTNRKRIAINDFSFDAARFRDEWVLLCAGDFSKQHYNSMTISWGSYGQVWNMMFFQVFVRPTRYTYEFMERYNSFTLSLFDKTYHDALALLGTRSGRDCNKIQEAGLTPEPSLEVPAPGFKEASLIIECKKIYFQDIDSMHFLEPSIETHYPHHDYHRMYFGSVVAVSSIN